MTKAPALTASSITRRLRRAGVDVVSARNLDRTYPQTDGHFAEVVGRVSVHLVTFDLVDGRIVERGVDATAAAAREALAGFVVELAGRNLEVTLPDRAGQLEARAERARGHAFTPRQCVDTDTCAICREVDGHGIHDAGRRATLAAAARAALTAQTAVQLELDVEPAPATVVVVPCSGAKLDRPAPARQLYTGSLHRMAAAAGDATGHRVVILSALHGLLAGDDVVAPYDVRMTDADSIDAGELARQLIAAGRPRLVALTPGAYTRRLAEAAELAGCQLVTPLAGSRGIGEIRGRLARIRDRRGELAA